jgi:hypothetical protein
MTGITGMMNGVERLERFSGLLVAVLLLLILAPLNAIVYASAGVKGTDREDALKVLPAVAAHPVGFVVVGLAFVALGGAVWLLTRALGKRLSARAQSQMGFGRALGLLAVALLALYGLYIGIRLPWIAAGYAHDPVMAIDAFKTYLDISGGLLLAAYVALGGWLLFLCLAMWREKTVSRYLTLLGMFCGLVLVLAFLADPSIVVLGQISGFFWALGVGFALLRPARDMQDTMIMAAPEVQRRDERGLPRSDSSYGRRGVRDDR